MFRRIQKHERARLLLNFCQALVEIKKPEEASQFITDLLSERESEILAQRLRIANLLIEGKRYHEIAREMGSSPNTTARVSAWLDRAGEGYRLIHERTRRYRQPPKRVDPLKAHDPLSWHQIKKRYTIYSLPQLVLEDIMRSANQRQKAAMQRALDRLKEKKTLYRVLNRILAEDGV